MPTLEIENLNKSYGDHKVLDNISLTLESGGIYGLLGANGAGKTTLFECLAGMTDYQGNMAPTKPYTLTTWRQGLGYLPSAIHFFPKTTGLEYLQFCIKARKKNTSLAEINYLNTFFELPLQQYITSYSHGMKQKVGILGVLLQKNHTLLLDEPLNGLDVQAVLIIIELLKELQRSGTSIVLSSHILASLYPICDAIFLLKKGSGITRYTPQKYLEIEATLLQDSGAILTNLKDYFINS